MTSATHVTVSCGASERNGDDQALRAALAGLPAQQYERARTMLRLRDHALSERRCQQVLLQHAAGARIVLGVLMLSIQRCADETLEGADAEQYRRALAELWRFVAEGDADALALAALSAQRQGVVGQPHDGGVRRVLERSALAVGKLLGVPYRKARCNLGPQVRQSQDILERHNLRCLDAATRWHRYRELLDVHPLVPSERQSIEDLFFGEA